MPSVAPASPRRYPISVCLDVELADKSSRDIDDTLLLLLVAGDPHFQLKCVTITPGTHAQVLIAQKILELTGQQHVPIGVEGGLTETNKAQRKMSRVVEDLGVDVNENVESNVREAAPLLAECLCRERNCLVITGSSSTNFAAALLEGEHVSCDRWLGQGGYPPARFLESSKPDSITSYNLNKDLDATRTVLEAVCGGRVAEGLLVSSKCHNSNTLGALLPRLTVAAESSSLRRLYKQPRDRTRRQQSLTTFLQLCSSVRMDKKLHDVLLAAIALDPSIASWTDGVDLEHLATEKGKVLWSSTSKTESRLRVTYDHDEMAFLETLLPLPDGVLVDDPDALMEERCLPRGMGHKQQRGRQQVGNSPSRKGKQRKRR